jgi:hypothetical protein
MGLVVTPGDLAQRGKDDAFRLRAQRELARLRVLIAVVEGVRARTYAGKSSPVAAAQRVLAEAETAQLQQRASSVRDALATGTRDSLDEALDDLRYDEEGFLSQSGALEPGLFDQIWLAIIDNPVADAVIVTGVATRQAVGAPIPEAMNGRDQALVDQGKELGSWAFGLGIVALAIGAAVVAVVWGRKS